MNVIETRNRITLFISVFFFYAAFFACSAPEGPDPYAEDPREKFEGNWVCQENCSSDSTHTTFSVSISINSTTENEVLIYNFSLLGSGYSARGIVSDYNITLPSQVVSSNTIQGSGTLSSSKTQMNMSYSINDGAATFNYTATFTKQ